MMKFDALMSPVLAAAIFTMPSIASAAPVVGDAQAVGEPAVSNSDTCAPQQPDEITICAERDRVVPYRIDPGILDTERAHKESPPPARGQVIRLEKCPPHGLRCSGQGAIPLSAIAMVALRTAYLAAAGEDWQTSLGVRDDSYDEYRTAKTREKRQRDERKPRFGIVSGSRR